MYEFFCEKIIPGCTHTERGEKKEEVRESALKHLAEHHSHGETREDWGAEVINDAMIYLPR